MIFLGFVFGPFVCDGFYSERTAWEQNWPSLHHARHEIRDLSEGIGCVTSWKNVRKSESCHFILTDSARDRPFFLSNWEGAVGGGGYGGRVEKIPHKIIPELVF